MGTLADRVGVATPQPQGLSLRRNFAWTVAGNVVYAACQWGMLVALAKLGSAEMVGQFALGLAIGAPIMLFANLQLRAVQATDARNEYRFGDYLGLRLATTLLAFAMICLIAWLAGYRWQTALVVVLVGIAKSVESVSDVVYGLMQKHERLDRIAIAMALRGVGSVTFFALALWLTRSVVWAVSALACWWAVVLLTYEWRTGKTVLKAFGASAERFAPAWAWPRLRRLAWLSFPLGLVMVLASLNTNIPRYFIEHHRGEAALGYFAALAYIVVAGQYVMTALGQSATPRLARYFATDPAAFKRLLAKMLALAVLIGLSGILVAYIWGEQVLTLLYRADYAQHRSVFVWLMAAATLAYLTSALAYGMTAARKLRPQAWFYAMSLATNTLACVWLVPVAGIKGAAWALLIGAAVTFVLYGIYSFRLVRPDVPSRRAS